MDDWILALRVNGLGFLNFLRFAETSATSTVGGYCVIRAFCGKAIDTVQKGNTFSPKRPLALTCRQEDYVLVGWHSASHSLPRFKTRAKSSTEKANVVRRRHFWWPLRCRNGPNGPVVRRQILQGRIIIDAIATLRGRSRVVLVSRLRPLCGIFLPLDSGKRR